MAVNVENTHSQIYCPLCSSSNVYHIGNLQYSLPVLYSSHEIKLSRVPELWKCKACFSLYSNYIVPENVAAVLYARGISGDRWSQIKIEAGKSKEIIELLDQNFVVGKRILDIGCNTGEVLDYAKKAGCITSGVEISMSSHNHLCEKGHQYFSELKDVDCEFDIIVAFDIVEHSYNLPLFFKTCNKILSKNGMMMILTGDINSTSARICRSKWWYFNYPEHIVFPSDKYFQNIEGFKVRNRIRTYAAVNYRHPPLVVIKGLFSGIIGGNYTGLPSIGPDHILICLYKYN